MKNRRQMLEWMAVGAMMVGGLPACTSMKGLKDMDEIFPYGIIGQMKVTEGKRAELIAILATGTQGMAGNISYVISEDQSDDNAIWITEYWESKEAHAASLQLPSVQGAISKGRAMIDGFGHRFEVTPKAGA